LKVYLAFVTLASIAGKSESRSNVRSYSKQELLRLRSEVSEMFHHAYDGYLKHAYPYDELRPLTCDGVDTWGSYSLTLIDALDTLAVLGNHTEFRRVYRLIADERIDFDSNINVSVFETDIRIVGGLISAHLLAKRAGVEVESGWPCNGPLLRLAEDVATRLLPAFDTATGMPYGTVNLRHGVPHGETSVTCTAAVGTYVVEFGALSRLTGNPLYEDTALRALNALWNHRSSIGLFGNHIDVQTGKWTATDAGIGAGVDSYYEYLVKGSALLNRPELMHMFRQGRSAVESFLNHDDWYFWATMNQGSVTMPVFQSLEAFWPGLLSLTGDTMAAMKTIHNYHQVWKQYGFLPEFYNVAQNGAVANREGYPLRPELIESAMYLYRVTKDPFLLTIGEDMLRSIQHSAKTSCGYATVKDVREHLLEDRMESFFLAETTKYLYLLFDQDNFIHNPGNVASVHRTPHGQCILDAGGYVFNTEAHPIDPAALQCCASHTIDEIKDQLRTNLDAAGSGIDGIELSDFVGDTIPQRLRQIENEREIEREKRRQEREVYLRKMEEQRAKRRAQIKKVTPHKTPDQATPVANNASVVGDGNSATPPVVIVNSSSELERDQLLPTPKASTPPEAQTATPPNAPSKTPPEAPSASDMGSNAPNFSETIDNGSLELPTANSEVLIKRQTKDETVVDISDDNEPLVDDDSDVDAVNSIKPVDPEEGGESSSSLLEKFSGILDNFLAIDAEEFDIDAFRTRVYSDNNYNAVINQTWYEDHAILSCPAKHFLERFSVQGEFFDSYQ